MKNWFATLTLFLFFGISASAQNLIKGRVIASTTGVAVPGSSVFINNTSKGTTADKDGNFELTGIPPGKHELIVSSIGYETTVFSFSSDQLPMRLRVELEVKVKELENVVVELSEDGNWKKWGKVFTDNFIGIAPNAARCRILNEKAIKFKYFKKSNRLVAYCDEAIILENSALGYKISYQLQEFEINFETRVSVFYGFPLFEELKDKRNKNAERWKLNRQKSYYGSMLHFMRSIYHNRVVEEEFEVRRVKKKPNTEKERVRTIYNTPGIEGLPDDSLVYYRKVMSRGDHVESVGLSKLTADSLVVRTQGPYKIIYFPDQLLITYLKKFDEHNYSARYFTPQISSVRRSYITLVNDRPVEIDVNGNYPPTELLSLGYWAYIEKMADFLPLDYEP